MKSANLQSAPAESQELAIVDQSSKQVAERRAPTNEPSDIFAVIARAAADPTVDLEKMKGLIQLRNEELSRIAEKEFNQAMTEAQNEMPMVLKLGENTFTKSRYARLEHIKVAIAPVLSKYGFSLMFSEGTSDKPEKIRVLCDVLHRAGHKIQRHMDLSRDDLGANGQPSKTRLHGEGSTFSYGCRYLTTSIFNIVIAGQDDDGNRANRPKPANPSSLQPKESKLKDLATALWRLLETECACKGEKTWDKINSWLWKMDILDGAVPETAPNLTEAQWLRAIEKSREKLK
jgi:hypothetical protein